MAFFTEYSLETLLLTFCTSKSSIIQMSSAHIKISNSIMLAVHELGFSAITHQVIQEDWTSSLTKVGIVQWCGSCGTSHKVNYYDQQLMCIWLGMHAKTRLVSNRTN